MVTLPANQVTLSTTVTLAAAWQPGETLWIQWRPENTSQSSYNAIDDIAFTAVIPEPTTMGLLGLGGLLVLGRRRQ